MQLLHLLPALLAATAAATPLFPRDQDVSGSEVFDTTCTDESA